MSRWGLQERLLPLLHVPGFGLELVVHGTSGTCSSKGVGSAATATRNTSTKHGPAQMGSICRWHGHMEIVVIGRGIEGGAGRVPPIVVDLLVVDGVVRHVSPAAPSFGCCLIAIGICVSIGSSSAGIIGGT